MGLGVPLPGAPFRRIADSNPIREFDMKKLLILAALVAVPALFGTGCASSKAYDDAVKHNEILANEKSALQAENERLEDQANRLRAENERLTGALAETKAAPPATVNEDEMYEKLRKMWEGQSGGDFDVIRRGGAAGIRIDDRNVLFKSGSWELTDKTKETLTKVAALLEKKMDAMTFIRVDGHTDSDPVLKAKAQGIQDNVHLSTMRAMSVRNFLVSKGLSADRVFVSGFGEHWPIASNSSSKGKSTNRRVEIFIGTADGLSIGDMPASTSKSSGKGTEQASSDKSKGKETVSKK